MWRCNARNPAPYRLCPGAGRASRPVVAARCAGGLFRADPIQHAVQAMSAVWGDQQSPTRDRVSRQELERRLLIIVCHLRHDESRIGPAQTGEGGRVLHRVEFTQGTLKASPMFTTVRNLKDGRWYVEDLDMRAVQPFCAGSAAQRLPTRPPTGVR